MGDSGGGSVDGGTSGTAGNGAVGGRDDLALPVAVLPVAVLPVAVLLAAAVPDSGCPQTGQNRDPGCTGCPHAGLPVPATPTTVTAG